MSLHAKNSNAVSVALKMARSAKAHGGQLKHPEHPKHPHHPDPYPEVGNPQDLEIKMLQKYIKGPFILLWLEELTIFLCMWILGLM